MFISYELTDRKEQNSPPVIGISPARSYGYGLKYWCDSRYLPPYQLIVENEFGKIQRYVEPAKSNLDAEDQPLISRDQTLYDICYQ